MEINFERLVSRGVTRELSRLMELANIKMDVNKLMRIILVGFFVIFIGLAFTLFALKTGAAGSALIGFGAAVFYVCLIYFVILYRAQDKRTKLEAMLPDYFMVASANLRSGIALDKSLLYAARPEFGFLSLEIQEMNRRVASGDTLENSLKQFAEKYRSHQLSRSVRMMVEAIRYGGAMADLLEQLGNDIRVQQTLQKEMAGQLLMYTIFITFAGLIAAPALYGLTSQMIVIVTKVWNGILTQNPGGLPSLGVSFLKPTPPQITVSEYYDFSLIAILIITGFAAMIVGVISTGSMLSGLKYLPLFLIIGIAIFLTTQAVVAALLSGVGGL